MGNRLYFSANDGNRIQAPKKDGWQDSGSEPKETIRPTKPSCRALSMIRKIKKATRQNETNWGPARGFEVW